MAELFHSNLTRRRFLAYAAAAAAAPPLASWLAACGGSPATTPSGKTIKKGGTLTVSLATDTRGFDATKFWDQNNFTISAILFSRLLQQDPNSASHLLPDLAMGVPAPDNGGTSYTFKLRNATFHDGTPVTAQDVKFSIERLLGPAEGSEGGSLYAGLIKDTDNVIAGKANTSSGIVVLDDHTIRFDLQGPNNSFLPLMSLPFASIVPMHAVQAAGSKWNFQPVGSGAFKLDSYQSGQMAIFSRYSGYFNASAINLDKIQLEVNVSPDTAILRIDRGDLDMMLDDVPSGSYNAIRTDPIRSKRLSSVVTDNVAFITLNDPANTPVFKSLDARRAIAMAIDKARIVQQLQGRGKVATGFWSPADKYWDPSYQGIPFDQAQAKQLVTSAGVAGMEVNLFWMTNYFPLDQIGASIAQDLATVGFKPNLKTADYSSFVNHTMDKGYIMPEEWAMDITHGSYVVASSFTSSSYQAAISSAACCNYSRYTSPEVDQLEQTGLTASTPAQEISAYQHIMRTVVDQALWIPLFYPIRVLYHGDRVAKLQVPTNWEGVFLSSLGLTS
jgi:oligopeptide transport system substrate-binding protein